MVAQWGNHKSAPSATLTGFVLAMPLSGSVPVSVKMTSAASGWTGPSVGYHWDDIWIFSGTCPGDSCTLSATVNFPWGEYPITLRGSGSTYFGTAQAPGATLCQSAKEKDTFTLTITAKGAVVKGAWQAWTGTMVLSAPLTASGGGYCPAGSWRFAITSS